MPEGLNALQLNRTKKAQISRESNQHWSLKLTLSKSLKVENNVFKKWHQTLENNLVEVRIWIHDNIQVNS